MSSLAGRLQRGINLSHWFAQVYRDRGYITAHFDAYLKEADIKLIAAMGFDHVRYTIGAEAMYDAANPGVLPEPYVARIQKEIAGMQDAGLAIIFDLHPETKFKKNLLTPEGADGFVTFWGALAKRFRAFDPRNLFFEVLNEPDLHDAAYWNALQIRAHGAIRQSAPEHTVILGGDQWSQFDELFKLELPVDPNIIANFHSYDPMILTHQGASWAPSWCCAIKGLTYPAEVQTEAEQLATSVDPESMAALREYRADGWSLDYLTRRFAKAAGWAAQKNVALTCNEFGVYRKYAPRNTRLAFIRDTRTALERNGIGWTMWDYAGDFAVALGEGGARTRDDGVLQALGLTE